MRYFTLGLMLFIGVVSKAQIQTPEDRLAAKNITLPSISTPVANYLHIVQTGKLLFLAGKGPSNTKGEYIKGKLGKDLTVDEGYKAAELTAINQLAVLKNYLGDLSKINRIVKVNGFVNCTDGFEQQPAVVNGFSDLMVYTFGDNGKHARTALGTNSLPFNMAVEIEMIVELK